MQYNQRGKMSFKVRIKVWRELRGFTITKLSKKSGVCLQDISRYEHNHRFPRLKNLKRLAKALGVGWRDLVGD